MDPRLLDLYNDELAHLREVGAEFAQEFPKIARRLSMDGLEVADPYVERLLEGFAFMAARVQLKLDAEYPQFIAHLLECVYPNFLAPVPSMMVARLRPDLMNPGLAQGARVPRGTALTSLVARGQNTRCEFRTAHEVRLWPLEITQAQVFAHAADLPLSALPIARQIRSGLRLRLQVHGGLHIGQLPLDALECHVAAAGETAYRLHELIGHAAIGSFVWPVAGGGTPSRTAAPTALSQWRDAAGSVRLSGHGDDQACLPETLRGLSGYRLLQEFSAMPQRFLFFELADLARRTARLASTEVDLVLLFSRAEPALEALVDASSIALHCTPAINLFPKRLDRIAVDAGAHEFHAVPDRTRPMDFEVHTVESVTGHGTGPAGAQAFVPLYAAHHDEPAGQGGYFTVTRAPRLLSQRQTQQGTRSAHVGTEVHLSLVRADGEPFRDDLRQLAVSALVTNRDLPILLGGTPNGEPNQGQTAWAIDGAGLVQSVECLRGPTRPLSRESWGQRGWSLIDHLTLNHLSIAGEDPRRAASALRSVLGLYGPPNDATWRRQVDGVIAVRARAVTRRLPQGGPLSFGSGVQVEVEIDEMSFQGTSAYLLGSVLEHFFARQAAVNTFTETELRSTTRGVIGRWPPRVGQQPLLSP